MNIIHLKLSGTSMLLGSILLCFSPLTVSANTPLSGNFQADKSCPAFHSIKKETNPGDLFTEKGKSYQVNGKNKVAATHYLIRIEGQQRWVSLDCGRLSENSTTNSRSALKPQEAAGSVKGDFLLAISWQAAFCQTHQNKKECKTQTPDRYDSTHLALHGLWPQPKNNAYCGVSTKHKSIDRRGAWHLLPALQLSDSVRTEMNKVMPGAASGLHRHEWYKHGTCYAEPEVYYRDSIALMKQVNDSAVQQLFASNIGKRLSAKQIRAAFDKSFGKGTGDKVNVRCSGKLIGELWGNLRGQVSPQAKLGDLLKQAPNVRSLSCKGGIVDPAGF